MTEQNTSVAPLSLRRCPCCPPAGTKFCLKRNLVGLSSGFFSESSMDWLVFLSSSSLGPLLAVSSWYTYGEEKDGLFLPAEEVGAKLNGRGYLLGGSIASIERGVTNKRRERRRRGICYYLAFYWLVRLLRTRKKSTSKTGEGRSVLFFGGGGGGMYVQNIEAA